MVSRTSSNIETQRGKEKCKKLFEISPKIRYVGIINEFGRTIAGQLRQGTVPLFKVEEARNEFFIEATRNRLRRHFEPSIGKIEFTITVSEKVVILTVSNATGSRLYYFTLDKDTNLTEVTRVKDIAKTLVTFEED